MYRAERAKTPQTGEGQLALAEWCRKNRLADQEQAHLHAALRISSQLITPERLERMGFRRIAGQWLSPEQWREWQTLNATAEASLGRWESRINAAVEQIAQPGKQKEAVLDRLAKLVDASAVPAVEYLLAGRSEESALLAVDMFT